MTNIFPFRFVIDETPYCLWTSEREQLHRFLMGIDPKYFEHIQEVHAPMLNSDDKTKQYAAVALRTAYFQGLETFFALICSAFQAPHSTVGWMLKYKNEELRNLIKKIHNGEPILAYPSLEATDWKVIAHRIFEVDDESRNFLASNFGKLWEGFAADFLNSENTSEYNNIKHGLRVQMGGFELYMGRATEIGVPTPEEDMIHFGGSEFGTSFYEIQKLWRDNKFNIELVKRSLNWNPVNHLFGLQLISHSIQNVLTFLKLMNKIQDVKLEYWYTKDEAFYKKPWEQIIEVGSINLSPRIVPSSISPISKEDILAFYSKSNLST